MSYSNRYKREFLGKWARIQAGMCPEDLCHNWGYRELDGDWGDRCSLEVECGAICTRHPDYQRAGQTEAGHTAGFDFFTSRWCWDARRQLPTDEMREFWFPTEWDPKEKRRQRYRRRRAPSDRAGARGASAP